MYRPIPNYNLLHAIYIRPDKDVNNDGAIVAAVKRLDGKAKDLHIIRNPSFEFWITKPAYRNQQERVECESLNRLDTFVCKYKDLYPAIAKALGDYYSSYGDKKKYNTNPHIYGLDITPITRMKIEYFQSAGGKIPPLDIGMLDIETSVIEQCPNEILCASYTDWSTRVTYEFINSNWCQCYDNELQERFVKELNSFVSGLNDKARKIWDKSQHTCRWIHCKNERDLIIKLVGTTLLCKPDLAGIWNMSYDIPYIEKRAIFNQIYLPNLFCHPDVPQDLRMYKWRPDTKQVEHFTDVWHQVEAPGYTRWYDPMCLYSRLRKVQGRENFYTLEYIGSQIVGSGKMKFGMNNSHQLMQTNDKVGYCVYNVFDTILPCIIDEVTGDSNSMMVLADINELSDFAKQTVMLKNQWYNYCRYVINSIPGCVPGGSGCENDWDKFIHNIGGAVLSPNLLEVKGSPHLIETSAPTALHLMANDIDATSMYPSIASAMNVSKLTKFATVLHVDGAPYSLEEINALYTQAKECKVDKEKKALYNKYKAMTLANSEWLDNLFGRLATTEENAVDLCSQLFDLPNYSEMKSLFNDFYKKGK